MKRWFVTGTDTGIGKTHVACALLRYLSGRGYRVAGRETHLQADSAPGLVLAYV